MRPNETKLTPAQNPNIEGSIGIFTEFNSENHARVQEMIGELDSELPRDYIPENARIGVLSNGVELMEIDYHINQTEEPLDENTMVRSNSKGHANFYGISTPQTPVYMFAHVEKGVTEITQKKDGLSGRTVEHGPHSYEQPHTTYIARNGEHYLPWRVARYMINTDAISKLAKEKLIEIIEETGDYYEQLEEDNWGNVIPFAQERIDVALNELGQ